MIPVLLCFAVLSILNGVFCEEKQIKAIAVLNGPQSPANGTVEFCQNESGGAVEVHVRIDGLKAGTKYGFHIHEKGDLTNHCISLGAHYNPDKNNHGAPNSTVRHVGDLGNVVADSTGKVNTNFSDPIISLIGSRTVLGRGVILHEGEDDLGLGGHDDSLTTGHAGGRMACGVIGLQSLTDEIPSSGIKHGILGSVILVGLWFVLFI